MVGGSGGVGERYDLNSLFLIKINFYLCVCVFRVNVCRCPRRPEEGFRSARPGPRAPDSWELADMEDGK